ncbi:hypothetical protein [Methylobacterium nodulans]|uniref:Uncharacterized protein n=1 Tax=Methylobacterium nodulans (strain LMG 21967 / CNCM I-2342 / ORS 2060) TaxID=460265 RepID=B8IVQ4_METNO|nr:hypothetical protein [Methylobacterium nodulans]ACL62494.1 hypothetical protein Mnod_8360 [Methylobacterium nodulans ORS 2060]
MVPENWPVATAHDPRRLEEARHQVHSLVQWLARIERSYGSQGNGAMPTLEWHNARNAITTHPLGRDLDLELRLPELVLQFREGGEAVSHPLHVEEHSPAHVEAWLLVELLHRGMDRERFSKALPYDVSGLMSGDAVEFSPEAYENELRVLTAWFSNAASVIARTIDKSQPEQKQTVTVRPDDLSLEAGASGDRILGFRTGRAELPEPFFYIRRGQGGSAAGAGESVLPVSQIPAHGGEDRVAQFLKEA